jgi:predicted oxidoreductase
MDERPEDKSPREWAQIEVGWTAIGLQIWCKRQRGEYLPHRFRG